MSTKMLSKSEFQARALEIFQQIETTGQPVLVTDKGHPIIEIRRINKDEVPVQGALDGNRKKRLIKKEIVLDKTSLSKSSLYRLIKEGRFPSPVPLTGRAVAWLESEIDEWIVNQANSR